MFWKDQLASEILAQSQCTYDWLLSLRIRFPQLRVKTIDARGNVPVIRFDDRNGEWYKPNEWAENHRQTVCCKYQEWHSRMEALGYDLFEGHSNGAQTASSGGIQGGDNELVNTLQQRINVLSTNYKCAMSMLKSAAGKGLSLDDKIKLSKYDESHPTLIF